MKDNAVFHVTKVHTGKTKRKIIEEFKKQLITAGFKNTKDDTTRVN